MHPAQIGPYRILRLLGEGGMGCVYEGIHESIERRVALKVLRPELARDPDVTVRFFNEARAVNRIDHPSLVQISDYGQQPDGTAYIVMEFLRGETLAQRIQNKRGKFAPATAIGLARQIADALSAAHKKGIVHRDLKPENLMLVPDSIVTEGERVKILDFGIAKLLADSKGKQTGTHQILGTPCYMSPEQCRGAREVDGKTDVYSLGVILYLLLSGRLPFEAESSGELIGMHLFQQPVPLEIIAPNITDSIAKLVNKLIGKDKNLRPSMDEVLQVLNQLTKEKQYVASDQETLRLGSYSATRTLKENTGNLKILKTWSAKIGLITTLFIFILLSAWSLIVMKRNKKENDSVNVQHIAEQAGIDTETPLARQEFVKQNDSTRPANPALAVLSGAPHSLAETSKGSQRPAQLSAAQAPKLPVAPVSKVPATRDPLSPTSTAFSRGQHALVLGLVNHPDVIATDPAKAWMLIGLSACHMRQMNLVTKAFQQTDFTGRDAIREQCNKFNVKLTASGTLINGLGDPVDLQDPEQILNKAQQSYEQGAYQSAIETAQLVHARGGQRMFDQSRIISLSACKTKNVTLLNSAIWRTSPEDRVSITEICKREGLERISNGSFVFAK